jgi:tubulin monoglycylase TTLL15
LQEQPSQESGHGPYFKVYLAAFLLALLAILVQKKDFFECFLSRNQSESLTTSVEKSELKYWIFGKNKDAGHLVHVNRVLKRLGFAQATNESDWDLLWAHDYPFSTIRPQMLNLKSHQKVNHFPGCGFITNKVDLATSDIKYLPKAFKLPKEEEEFRQYAAQHPKKLFVQKHNQHRHIYIKSLDEIDFADNDTFIQEFVDDPLLVDGYKFDMGVYTIITSVDPLRVYVYWGDVLFRYCAVPYHPFDAKNVEKYIVGDDYLPTWEVPSLKQYYTGLGFSMKGSFDAYLMSQGRDPGVVWDQVEDAIRHAILAKEKQLADSVSEI